MTNWIHKSNKKPLDGQKVLVWDEIFGMIELGSYNASVDNFQEQDEYGDFIDGYPNYWMPLPNPPKDNDDLR